MTSIVITLFCIISRINERGFGWGAGKDDNDALVASRKRFIDGDPGAGSIAEMANDGGRAKEAKDGVGGR